MLIIFACFFFRQKTDGVCCVIWFWSSTVWKSVAQICAVARLPASAGRTVRGLAEPNYQRHSSSRSSDLPFVHRKKERSRFINGIKSRTIYFSFLKEKIQLPFIVKQKKGNFSENKRKNWRKSATRVVLGFSLPTEFRWIQEKFLAISFFFLNCWNSRIEKSIINSYCAPKKWTRVASGIFHFFSKK